MKDRNELYNEINKLSEESLKSKLKQVYNRDVKKVYLLQCSFNDFKHWAKMRNGAKIPTTKVLELMNDLYVRRVVYDGGRYHLTCYNNDSYLNGYLNSLLNDPMLCRYQDIIFAKIDCGRRWDMCNEIFKIRQELFNLEYRSPIPSNLIK